MMDEIFDWKMPKAERKNTGNLWEDMNANLNRVFPDEKELEKILYLAKPEDKQVKNVFKKKYLPYNYRNNQWLGEYVCEVYNQICPEMEHNANLNEATNYVSKSFSFNKQRSQFETMLIKEIIKSKTISSTELNPLKIREAVLNTVSDDFGINRYHASVEMEKNNAWRRLIYSRSFEKHLQEKYAVSFPSIETLHVLSLNYPNQFVDFMWLKNNALKTYQNLGERCYFDACKDARHFAREAGYKIEDLSLTEKQQKEMQIGQLTDKLANEIKTCCHLISQGVEK